jgi:hypothetical protein
MYKEKQMKKVWMHRTPVAALSIVMAVLGILAAACSGGDAKNPDLTAKVGESVKTEKFELAVTSISTIGTFGSSYSPTKPADGAVFVVVRYSIKNISKEPQSVLLTSVKIVDPQGVTYDQAAGATLTYKIEADIHSKSLSELNPGLSEKDAVLFEISKELWNKPGWKILVDADKMLAVTVK